MMQIQFISHHNDRFDEIEGIRMALEGGCRWIQLRMKDANDQTVIDTASIVRPMCDAHGATLIIDDRVHLVEPTRADGVHLGKNDMPIDQARQLLGPDKIIGGTANTIEDIRRINAWGADYIGCGPLRYTETKKNLAPHLGYGGYRLLLEAMRREAIRLPIIAIGGVTTDDLQTLKTIGLNGIAVSSAVLQSENPIETMQKFIHYEP